MLNRKNTVEMQVEAPKDSLVQIISSLQYLNQEAYRSNLKNLAHVIEGVIKWSEKHPLEEH